MWSYYCIKKSPKSTKFTTEAENPNSSSLQQGSALNIINNAMLMARWAERVARGLAAAVRVPRQKPARVLALLPVSLTLLRRSRICSGGKHPARCAPKAPRFKASEGGWRCRHPPGAARGRCFPALSGRSGSPGKGSRRMLRPPRLPAQWRGFSPKCFPPNLLFGLGFYFFFSYHVQQENRNPYGMGQTRQPPTAKAAAGPGPPAVLHACDGEEGGLCREKPRVRVFQPCGASPGAARQQPAQTRSQTQENKQSHQPAQGCLGTQGPPVPQP